MSIAVIDMGTNTFHLMIVEVDGSSFHKIASYKKPVRLGKGGITKGYITEAAGQRALNALHCFKEKIEEYQVEQVFATATSAIRNARNGSALVDRIYDETGIHVKVISGDEEAETIYYGVKNALALEGESSLVVDIGGGSIEFIICNNHGIIWKRSFEIGGQRLLDLFHQSDRITTAEINALNDHFHTHLAPLLEAVAIHKPSTLIGSSGTFDTLSDIYLAKIKQSPEPTATELPLTIASFYDTYGQMISGTREERLEVPGMIALRADMIVVAVELVKFVIEQCKLKDIRVSAYALKEGVLLKAIHSLDKVQTS